MEISRSDNFQKHLNQYDVIHLDIQWCCVDAGVPEIEVEKLCSQFNQDFEEVKRWYDGYLLEDYQVYNSKAVVSVMTRDKFRSYWSQTGTYESIMPLISMDFDGLKSTIIKMLAGEQVKVKTATYQNDMISFKNKDDVLTLLIHLGYLAYDANKTK